MSFGPIGDFADADDDGNAVVGEGELFGIFFLFRFLNRFASTSS